MPLIELGSSQAVQELITKNANAIVTFSAHWCGPCKASKPALQQLAEQYSNHMTRNVKFGIVYESDLGDDIHQYSVRAFPTYVLFVNGTEKQRVQGANLKAVEDMVLSVPESSAGETLGGGGSAAAALSPAEARAARLAKLTESNTTKEPAASEEEPKEESVKKTEEAEPMVTDDKKEANDVEMGEAGEAKDQEPEDPTAKLNPDTLKTLTESMGFSLLRAQKGLLYGNGETVESAVEWLMEHQDDVDIDEPIPKGGIAKSYKCNDCGKVLSNMANLELHANKTGHSDFEESTENVKPLTEEEKAKKIAEIKELLKAKRAEREEAEKIDDVDREKQRRSVGKEMAKTREQLEAEERKREAYLRKKQKEESKRERERLRAELAKDKMERVANKGKLSSRLGVEGYKPDGIQYDVDGGELAEEQRHHMHKKLKADAAKIDEYIAKISGYRAGGDGGKCLKVLSLIIGNVVDHPDEEKYKSVGMETKTFKTKIKPFVGAKSVLVACGFQPNEEGDHLVLQDDACRQTLTETKAKLEAALKTYG